jgi:hypothetical protein
MATQLTQYQMARVARKSSDITRLASQYRNSVNDLSGQFQSSFADYQKKRDEIMAPYNTAVDQYKADFTTYETNLAGYKTKLSDYQARLADVSANPLEQLDVQRRVTRQGQQFLIDGAWKTSGQLGDEYTVEGTTLYKARSAGKFDATAPKAPDAPVQPAVDAFDSTQFDAKRAELDTGYKREVGERKAARASAVSRKSARPLLQGQ